LPPAKIRHEWFQTDSFVTISYFIKNAPSELVVVDFTEKSLHVEVPMPNSSTISIDVEPLAHEIDAKKSSFQVLKTKIEIKLKKKVEGRKWGVLEGRDESLTEMMSAPKSNTGQAYPSSAKKVKNQKKNLNLYFRFI